MLTSLIPKIQFTSEKSEFSKISSFFDKNGFVRIDGVFNEKEVKEMIEEMKNIINNFDPEKYPKQIFETKNDKKHLSDNYFLDSVDKISFFYEKEAIDEKSGNLLVDKEKALNKVGHALHWINPVFKHYTFHQRIKKIIQLLSIHKNPLIVQSMYIFKQPKIGGDVIEHVDSSFLHTKRPESLIGIWIALNNSKKENGCLWFIPGSHKDFYEQTKDYKLVRNKENISKNEGPLLEIIGKKPQINAEYIPVECESGSLILIDGNVLHKSEKNISNLPRHVYAFHLVDLNENEKWENSNWLQETEKYKFPKLFNINI
ncbi:hypothetical protein Mgra_00001806 [Meloidogyne graminicola]|uniref:Phytanoyl-CoA dioxygenase n=1 Tax=Meloidogyne graminicola TaxID=189291 RepID=A0A8S9ZY87_9BILA|nr:hypothetical protein Mgra_00001806 [Meloidogyne graminicola]